MRHHRLLRGRRVRQDGRTGTRHRGLRLLVGIDLPAPHHRLSPLGPVPVPGLEPAGRIRQPAGRASRHLRTHADLTFEPGTRQAVHAWWRCEPSDENTATLPKIRSVKSILFTVTLMWPIGRAGK